MPEGSLGDIHPVLVGEDLVPVGGASGSTDIREHLLVFLKVFKAFRVF